MKDKTVIVFDWDGTILDSYPCFQEILKKLARQFKVPLPDDSTLEFKIIWGHGGYNVIKLCFPNQYPELVYQEWKKLEKNMKINLIKGTEETVKKLKEAGYLAGLVTNRSWKSLKQYKKLWKPLNFDIIQTSEYKKSYRMIRALNPFASKRYLTTKYFKPNLKVFKPFIRLLEKRKIIPAKIICVDDSLVGFEAAFWANFGNKFWIEFVGVLTGSLKTEEEWRQAAKTAGVNKKFPVISSIAELPEWLEKNSKGDD